MDCGAVAGILPTLADWPDMAGGWLAAADDGKAAANDRRAATDDRRAVAAAPDRPDMAVRMAATY